MTMLKFLDTRGGGNAVGNCVNVSCQQEKSQITDSLGSDYN